MTAKNKKNSLHTFSVLAYKESPYLEDCIKSVTQQKYPSEVILATSTPNQFIKNLAKKYGLELKINHGKSGIGADFDFALQAGETELVTIAHQDDIYDSEYIPAMIGAYQSHPESLIIFPDYYELRNGERVEQNTLLKVKHLLLWPLRFSSGKSKFMKRMTLRFGDPISCPAVTFNTRKVQPPLFDNEMKNDVDWHAWEVLSKQPGNFTFVDRKLMGHRIHTASATTENIQNHTRTEEDFQILQRFWPKWIARKIAKLDARSEKSNQNQTEDKHD